jgi:hypothetical protein
VKTTFKLKINIKRNPLNFKSILWNHLQAFPIWWDYPFKTSTRRSCEIPVLHLQMADDKWGSIVNEMSNKNSCVPV